MDSSAIAVSRASVLEPGVRLRRERSQSPAAPPLLYQPHVSGFANNHEVRGALSVAEARNLKSSNSETGEFSVY